MASPAKPTCKQATMVARICRNKTTGSYRQAVEEKSLGSVTALSIELCDTARVLAVGDHVHRNSVGDQCRLRSYAAANSMDTDFPLHAGNHHFFGNQEEEEGLRAGIHAAVRTQRNRRQTGR